jgi:hypothetical protein
LVGVDSLATNVQVLLLTWNWKYWLRMISIGVVYDEVVSLVDSDGVSARFFCTKASMPSPSPIKAIHRSNRIKSFLNRLMKRV